MATAAALTAHFDQLGLERSPNGIFAIIRDEHATHCMKEPMIDAWWESLPAHVKASIYETELESGRITMTPRLLPPSPAASAPPGRRSLHTSGSESD